MKTNDVLFSSLSSSSMIRNSNSHNRSKTVEKEDQDQEEEERKRKKNVPKSFSRERGRAKIFARQESIVNFEKTHKKFFNRNPKQFVLLSFSPLKN